MLRETDLTNEELEGYRIVVELDSCPAYRLFLGDRLSQTTSDQRVTIKLLNRTHTDIQQGQQDILQILSSLQQLQHPHILSIQSIGTYKERPYFISEYIDTESLHHRLQDKYVGHPMPLEEALPILAQTGQALHYAHLHHIVHGNVKPQNILLGPQDDVLVTDFSLHTLLPPEKTEDTRPLEIFAYWAPELLSGHVSEKSDQYALACIAYEMLTGCKAFTVPSVKSPGRYFKTKSLIEPGRFNATLPSYIEEAILHAMSKDPAQRYPDIQAFLAAMGISPVTENTDQQKRGGTLDLPVTPLPAIHAITLARMDAEPPEEAPLHTDPNNSVLTPLSLIATRSRLPFWLTLLNLPLLSMLKNKLFPLKTAFLSGTINRPPFRQAWQRLTHLRRSTVIIGLLALALVMGSLIAGFSSLAPAKKPGTSAHAITTTTIPFPSQTGQPGPTKTVLSTPSSNTNNTPFPQGIIPHPTSTPILIQLPTPPSALTPGPTSSSHPTPRPTPAQGSGSQPTPVRGSNPQPTPVQGSNPQPTPTQAPQPTPVQGSNPQPTPTQAPQPTPTPVPTSPPVSVSAPVQVPLNFFFNNRGIGDRPGMADFDGSGFSYVAQLMPSGQINVQGVPYQFPSNSRRTNDNLIPFGQTVSFTSGNYQRAYLLASSSWGPISGTVTIHYTDGSTSNSMLTVPDWCSGASNALSASYRYGPNTNVGNVVYIYAIPIALDPSRTANALQLPRVQYGSYRNGRMHIFALTLEP